MEGPAQNNTKVGKIRTTLKAILDFTKFVQGNFILKF